MITIRNKENLYSVIHQIANGEWDDSEEIRFVDYPRFEIILRGERFDGGIPMRIMPALGELQRAIDTAAEEIIGKVDADTQRRTEDIIWVDHGSSRIFSDLSLILNTLVENKKTARAITLTIILATSISGVAEHWIDARQDVMLAKIRNAENDRLHETFRAVVRNNKGAERITKHCDTLMTKLIKNMEANDMLVLDGDQILDGRTGKRLLLASQPELIQERMGGKYLVLSVESGKVRNGFRMKVRSMETGAEFNLQIPEGTLTEEQQTKVRAAEWKKQPLNMRINVTRTKNKIRKATLISVGSIAR